MITDSKSLLHAVFDGDLKDEWNPVFRAINDENRNGEEELAAYNDARLKLFQERVPAGTFNLTSEWPHSDEFQMKLLREYNIPPSVNWISRVNDVGDTLVFLTPAQFPSSEPFWFCCLVPDAGYLG